MTLHKRIGSAAMIAAVAVASLAGGAARAEDASSIQSSGFRFGLVYVTDPVIKGYLKQKGASDVMTAFGWQLEYEYLNTGGGTSGVIEFVPVAVGLESGLFVPSVTLPIGVRFASGLELGFGPNVSGTVRRVTTKDDQGVETARDVAGMGVGMTAALGMTLRHGRMGFPVNLAAIRNQNGYRVAFLVGWHMGEVPR